MGGPGSRRWREHTRPRRVEDSLAINLAVLRRHGLLGRSGGHTTVHWKHSFDLPGFEPAAFEVVATALIVVGAIGGGDRFLGVQLLEGGSTPAAPGYIRLVPFRPHLGGVRWFAECPVCERRFLKLYLPYGRSEFACRECHHLQYRSVLFHDKRLDLARRDPEQFLARRSHLLGRWSLVVTGDLGLRAVRAMGQPRRGRGWGAKSETLYKRAVRASLAPTSSGA